MAVNSGDSCDKCGGYYVVTNSRVSSGSRVQYLACRSCGHRPDDNKRILKASDPTPRFSRGVTT